MQTDQTQTKRPPFSTNDEIAFLRMLGSWSERSGGRRELLQKYIDAAPLRDDWGRIDANAALSEARRLLACENSPQQVTA